MVSMPWRGMALDGAVFVCIFRMAGLGVFAWMDGWMVVGVYIALPLCIAFASVGLGDGGLSA